MTAYMPNSGMYGALVFAVALPVQFLFYGFHVLLECLLNRAYPLADQDEVVTYETHDGSNVGWQFHGSLNENTVAQKPIDTPRCPVGVLWAWQQNRKGCPPLSLCQSAS